MVPRRGFPGHVIYDDAVRRGIWLCLGALAFCFVSVGLDARAQPDITTPPTETTAPPQDPTTTVVTTPASSTSTTARATTTSTTRGTTTTAGRSTAPVPPPASGPSQTLVPDLLGAPVDIASSTTTTAATVPVVPRAAVDSDAASATNISSNTNAPSGLTLILATVAWLASLGGLLLYAEDRASARWKHLAR
jgi:hypothetical protein